jgi:hypothetical protein
MRQAGNHLAHCRQTLVALGGKAHAMGISHIRQQHDASLPGLQRGVDPGDASRFTTLIELPLAGRFGLSQSACTEIRPVDPRQDNTEHALHRLVGLNDPGIPIQHHHACRQGAHQHAQTFGQLTNLGLQPRVGAGQCLRCQAELAKGIGQLAGIKAVFSSRVGHGTTETKFTGSQLRPANTPARRQIGGKKRC